MPEGTFAVEILTPEAKLLEGSARAVMLRSSEGELTVLDGHTPLVTDVVIGPVRVERDGGEVERLAVHGGFLQVQTGPGAAGAAGATGATSGEGAGAPAGAAGGDTGTWSTRVTVLAGVGERAERIDVARAEQARTEAQSRVDDLRSRIAQRGPVGAEETEGGRSEDAELAAAEAALRRAQVRIEVAGH